jgi:cytochrome c5
MALSRLNVSCVFIAEAALILFLIGYADHRDLAPTEADRPVAASTEPRQAQAVASTPALTKVSAAGITLQSVRVDIPDRETTFPGPGSDAINNNCLVCHSAGMVLNQPSLPKAAWQAEVDKMIHVYKAPVAPEDVAAIVDYLAKIKGVD